MHVGRQAGLGATPAQLLNQASAALSQLLVAWNHVQNTIRSIAGYLPCSGLGPASLVPALKNISDVSCQVGRMAALSALGYTVSCKNANGADVHALNAQNAANQACTITYAPEYGEDFGVLTIESTDSQQSFYECLDFTYLQKVGAQLQAAQTAVREAQSAALACAAAQQINNLPIRFTKSGPVFTVRRVS